LKRADVHSAVVAGVGAFLQHVDVDVEHPVMRGGKFFGYRILKFKGDPSFWDGVDLGPGDIVTRVNGFSVGTPDEAHEALQSLDVSSELKVEFERAGKLRELRYAIIDDVGPNSAPPPR
jgi:type II secretory pathway component PulC